MQTVGKRATRHLLLHFQITAGKSTFQISWLTEANRVHVFIEPWFVPYSNPINSFPDIVIGHVARH